LRDTNASNTIRGHKKKNLRDDENRITATGRFKLSISVRFGMELFLFRTKRIRKTVYRSYSKNAACDRNKSVPTTRRYGTREIVIHERWSFYMHARVRVPGPRIVTHNIWGVLRIFRFLSKSAHTTLNYSKVVYVVYRIKKHLYKHPILFTIIRVFCWANIYVLRR